MDELMEQLSFQDVSSIIQERQHMMDSGRCLIPQRDTDAEKIARLLHPASQHLKVAEVSPGRNCMSYTLVPAEADGSCAPFIAGQYLSIRLQVGSRNITRPYSICSSPRQAMEGKYVISVDNVTGGLASAFIHDTWQIGTQVEASAPMGTFTFEPLRDAYHVIALAGGSGITPFLSMARAISDGTEDFDLTILYGTRTMADAVFADELALISKEARGKVRVVQVLQKEVRQNCEFGLIDANLIRKYAPLHSNFSVFLCGPQPMYRTMQIELPKLRIEEKYIRWELFGEILNPCSCLGPPSFPDETIHITVKIQGKEYRLETKPEISLLRALESADIYVHSGCRSGVCGRCRAHIISGETWTPAEFDCRRLADEQYGWVHLCNTWPLSDVTLEI